MQRRSLPGCFPHRLFLLSCQSGQSVDYQARQLARPEQHSRAGEDYHQPSAQHETVDVGAETWGPDGDHVAAG